jgi:hypothetical protein
MTVTFGTVDSAKAYRSFAPCLMIPPYSWLVPGRNPGTSTNVRSGMLSSLDRGVDVEAPRENRRLVGRDPDGPAVHPREADDDVLRKMFLDLEEVAVVHHLLDHVPDVVRFRGDVRYELVQTLVHPVGRVVGGDDRRVFHVVLGHEGEEFADQEKALFLVLGGEMRHTAALVVRHRPAQILLGHFLVGHRLDDIRAGHEHVGGVLHHQDEIGDRR